MPTKKINQTTDKNKVNTAETTGTAPVVESMPFPHYCRPMRQL